jgi:hypothetical protein
MKDLKVTIGTTAATSFGSNFLIPDGTLAFKVDGTAVNLPSGLFYTLRLGTTGVDHNIDTISNRVNLAKRTTAPNVGGFTGTSDNLAIRPLNLANGINVQLVTDTVASPNVTSEFGLANDSTIENKLLYVQVTFFRAVEDNSSYDPLNPLFDLEYVGHDTVQLWYAPVQFPGITATGVITESAGTVAFGNAGAARLTVTSDKLGVIYYISRAAGAAVATSATLLATGTAVAYTTVNTAQVILFNNAAAGSTQVDFVIVANDLSTTSLVVTTAAVTLD